MAHENPSPLAGQTVRIRKGVTDPAQGAVVAGAEYRVEDWWDRVSGGSWMTAQGNPAALQYAMRTSVTDLNGHDVPIDDEVLYGKVGPFGHLVHLFELEP